MHSLFAIQIYSKLQNNNKKLIKHLLALKANCSIVNSPLIMSTGKMHRFGTQHTALGLAFERSTSVTNNIIYFCKWFLDAKFAFINWMRWVYSQSQITFIIQYIVICVSVCVWIGKDIPEFCLKNFVCFSEMESLAHENVLTASNGIRSIDDWWIWMESKCAPP